MVEDVSIFKVTQFTEKVRWRVEAQGGNVTNRVVFCDPNTNWSSGPVRTGLAAMQPATFDSVRDEDRVLMRLGSSCLGPGLRAGGAGPGPGRIRTGHRTRAERPNRTRPSPCSRVCLKRDPASADAHNWLGVAYLQKNSLTEAAAEFRQAIKLKPGFVRAYNNLGSTLAQAGDIAQGIQVLQEGLKYAPRRLPTAPQPGNGAALEGRCRWRAGACSAPCFANSADSPELQYQYGQTLRQKGDLDGAILAFEKSLDLNPESQEAYYGLGQALKQLGSRARPARAAGTSESLKAGSEALSRGDFVSRTRRRGKSNRRRPGVRRGPPSARLRALVRRRPHQGCRGARRILATEAVSGRRQQLPRDGVSRDRGSAAGAPHCCSVPSRSIPNSPSRMWTSQSYSCGREALPTRSDSSRPD